MPATRIGFRDVARWLAEIVGPDGACGCGHQVGSGYVDFDQRLILSLSGWRVTRKQGCCLSADGFQTVSEVA